MYKPAFGELHKIVYQMTMSVRLVLPHEAAVAKSAVF